MVTMPGMDATGTFEYNGFAFVGAHSVRVEETPVLDKAGRAIKYMEVVIYVSAIVAPDADDNFLFDKPDSSIDEYMEDVRARLSQIGRYLVFKDKGFGTNIELNDSSGSGFRDVNFGPIPGKLTWTPIGDSLAAEITWSVKCHIGECTQAARDSGLRALTYNIEWSINRMGDTIRTINGELEIAMTSLLSSGSRSIPDTADRYFDLISVATIPGFHRERRRQINDAKNVLTFSIVDTQIPSRNPYPAGIVEISAKHTADWKFRQSSAQTVQHIECDITPDPSVHPVWAWIVFLQIVRRRMLETYRRGRQFQLVGLRASEDIFGRTMSFGVDYYITGCLKDFIGDSGLFTSMGTDWNLWSLSLENFAQHPRGHARMIHNKGWDVIVDLCQENQISTQDIKPLAISGFPTVQLALRNDCPPAEQSWLVYDVRFEWIARSSTFLKKVLVNVAGAAPFIGEKAEDFLNEAIPDTNFVIDATGDAVELDPVAKASLARIEKNHPVPEYLLRFYGRAVRVCHKIAHPALKYLRSNSGRKVDLHAIDTALVGRSGLTNFFDQRTVGNLAGQPVYAATWSQLYAFDGQTIPTDLMHPPSPDQCMQPGEQIQIPEGQEPTGQQGNPGGMQNNAPNFT